MNQNGEFREPKLVIVIWECSDCDKQFVSRERSTLGCGLDSAYHPNSMHGCGDESGDYILCPECYEKWRIRVKADEGVWIA